MFLPQRFSILICLYAESIYSILDSMDQQKQNYSKKLFSVPIYFRSKEEHRKYFEAKWHKYLEERSRHHQQFDTEITEKDKKKWDLEFKHSHFHFWKYSEIIGYVEFRKRENAVYAFVILAETDKFAPIINKKTFRIFEELKPLKITLKDKLNEQITKEIYESLIYINNSSMRFQQYFIDTSEIDNFVHLINFHEI